MPKAIDVTRYEYGDDYSRVLAQINTVREALMAAGIDPEEVQGDINPDHTPNSTY
ncbi:MAG: penicillin-binding protein [Oceanospirillaceae bacterium]|nr:penicillin-binding protein [Oceanospirillaceae bacterium]MCP5349612.1 penicillin-binding protein [Oceanospirillaceae bacterium]